MRPPKVYVIILNYNGLRDTIECLRSLKKITYSNYDVVVVDNGSKGNDVEALKTRFGDYVHIIRNEENLGFAEGSNVGIRYVMNRSADYILLMNNDIVVDPRFLTELVKVAERDECVAALSPKVYFYYEPQTIQLTTNFINFRTGAVGHVGASTIDHGQYDRIMETDEVNGCAFLIRSSVIRKVGLLSPVYFSYFEETEWSVLAKREGLKLLYVPSSKVWHKVSRTAGVHSPFYTYYMTRNRILFMKRNASKSQFAIFFFHFLFFQSLPTVFSFIRGRRLRLMVPYIRGIMYHLRFRV